MEAIDCFLPASPSIDTLPAKGISMIKCIFHLKEYDDVYTLVSIPAFELLLVVLEEKA
jgi:hypothetical protein